MSRIDAALTTLAAMDRGMAGTAPTYASATRTNMLLSLVYLCLLLSIPLQDVQRLIWFALFPIIWASVAGIGYATILRRSLYVLPLIVFVGIFNPIIDRAPAFVACGVEVSRGWVSFISIIVR